MPANIIIQFRRGTAASWLTSNPILAAGEMGYETDTTQFKIGNGTTAWVSLPYGGLTGPAQTQVIVSYGDGSDGNVTLSSGTTTLSRDMFYNNLTISGTGVISTVGYKIFVAGIFDISAAQAGAVVFNGNNGGSATVQTGGVVGAAVAGVTVGGTTAGSAGATGAGGVGVTAAAPGNVAVGNGNIGGAGGAGGASTNAGGVSRAGATVTLSLPIRRFEQDLIRGIALINGGAPGGAGSSGGFDGTNQGRGGGGSGAGGGVVAIWASTIARGSSVTANIIQANGGNGGNGGPGAATNEAGGGGGGGGGGGWVFIQYGTLTGSAITNALQASGGNGGNGGIGFGTGSPGSGGTGGAGGRITLLKITTSVGSENFGSAGSGPTGTLGGAGNAVEVTL